MSLIQEALEKAGKVEEPPTEPRPEIRVPKFKFEWEKKDDTVRFKIAAGVLALFPAVLGVGLFVARIVRTPPSFPAKVIKNSAPSRPASQVEVTSKGFMPALSSLPRFELTGIMTSGGQNLALINDQVVAAGDHLRGKAVVKEINEKNVVLELQGKEIKLSL